MKKKGGALGPTYTTAVDNVNLCKEELNTQYFSKVIEYKTGKVEDINTEIQSIIMSTEYISKIPDASKYVLYPNLDLSCGMGEKFSPIPGLVREKYPDVAAIFVMPQAQPLTFKLQEVSKQDTKEKIPIVIEYLNNIRDAYNFLNNNRPKENPITKANIIDTAQVFHGDPQIHNLVIDNGRVKFIDYSIYNPKFSTISEETPNLKETIETLITKTGLRSLSLEKKYKQSIDIPTIIFNYIQYLNNIINPQDKPSTIYRRTRYNSSPREQTPSKTQKTEATPYHPIGFRGFDTPPPSPKKFTFHESSYRTP